MKGVQSVKKSELNSKTCYVMLVPPSFEELEKRLRGRGIFFSLFYPFLSFSILFFFSFCFLSPIFKFQSF